jgi:hypothetical protein
MKTDHTPQLIEKSSDTLRLLRGASILAACALSANCLFASGNRALATPAGEISIPAALRGTEAKSPTGDAAMRQLAIPAFHVRDTDTSAVIRLAERYLGDLSSRPVPAFVLRLDSEALSKRISIEADGVTALELLKQIATAAGIEVLTERDAIVFAPSGKGLAASRSVKDLLP